MQTIIAGQPWTFNIELDPPADVNSVTWSLVGNDGTLLSSYIDVAQANLAAANRVSIPVPAPGNTKTNGAGLTENRFLRVLWTTNGATYSKNLGYILIDFIPLMVDADQVRASVGLTTAELTDDEIDILGAARMVQADIGNALFQAALIAGDTTTYQVNMMVAYKAVLNFTPSLQLRIAALMAEGETKFQRLQSISVKELLASLRGAYDGLREALTAPAYIAPTLFCTSLRAPPARFQGGLGTPILADRYFPWGLTCLPYQTL